MALHQYIGARYVPKFYENSSNTSEWRSGVIYEPLTIVTYNGNSYTSKRLVPADIGDPSSNSEYWVATGLYNAQIAALSGRLNIVEDQLENLAVNKVYNTVAEMLADFREGDNACFVLDSAIDLDGESTYKPGRANFYRWAVSATFFEYPLTHGGYAVLVIPAFQPVAGSCSAVDAIPNMLKTAYSYTGVTKPGGFNLDNGSTVTNVQSQSYSGPFIPDRHEAIQCSQFIDALLYGVDYQKSKLANPGNPNYLSGGYCKAFIDQNGDPLYLAANEMAHVCAANGWLKVTEKLKYAEVGDLLFFSRADDAGNWRDISHIMLCIGKTDNAVITIQVGDVDWFPGFTRTELKPGFANDGVKVSKIIGNLSNDFDGIAQDGYRNYLFGIGRIPYDFPKVAPKYTKSIHISGTYAAGASNLAEYLLRNTENITGRFGLVKLWGYTQCKDSKSGAIISSWSHDSAFSAIGSVLNTDTTGFQGGIVPAIMNSDGAIKNAEVAFTLRTTGTTQSDAYDITATLELYE